jgi:hypothetical protein
VSIFGRLRLDIKRERVGLQSVEHPVKNKTGEEGEG